MAEQKAGGFGNRYTFNGKELDALSGLYYYGARFYDPVIGNWLSVDNMAADFAGWSPYNYCLNNPIILIDPDGNKPTPREAALIATHIYGGTNVKLEGGWMPSTRTFGIKTGQLENGMYSMIYERTVNGKIELVYAFQGTNPSSGVDWKNNAQQALGKSEQYQMAIDNSISINDQIKNNDSYELSFVGHSLGGGLAAASAYATGNEAITFNPAGVSQKTLDNNLVTSKKGSMNDMIQAYIMTTDPLNNIQNNNGNITGALMPDVDGTRHPIKPTSISSRLNGHSMDNLLIEIMKIFKADD